MTALQDLIAQIRGTINRTDLSDSIVTGWIRMAEERFNDELVCGEMIVRSQITMTSAGVEMPVDWIGTEYVKYVPTSPTDGEDTESDTPYNYDRKYGRPIKYCTPDEYAAVLDDPGNPGHYKSFHTMIGDQLFLSPVPDPTTGTNIELGYIARVPPLDATNDVYERYPSLYLNASLVFSAPYLDDDERITTWAGQATASIQRINAAWERSKRGNGPLHVRMRSFG